MERYTISSLDAPVPNDYWDNGSETLLVMLPGLGYTNQMPVMFYVHQMAMARNWDILQVNYDYRGLHQDLPRDAWDDRFVIDCLPAIEAALAQREYTHVVLAGKSIGTRVITALLAAGFDHPTAYIWLTPLFTAPEIFQAAREHRPSVAVFGDNDFAMDGVDPDSLEQSGIHSIVMPGGDHGLQIAGKVADSIEALAACYRQLDSWLTDTVQN